MKMNKLVRSVISLVILCFLNSLIYFGYAKSEMANIHNLPLNLDLCSDSSDII